MNISEIHVDNFGAWHDLTLNDLSKGATVFYGPNEAGKTTLLNTIRTVLYGFSEKRCDRYLPPAQGSRAGGSLHVSDVSGKFNLHRSAPSLYRGGPGTLNIRSDDGNTHGNEFLSTLLAGVDETIFNNVFAVGLTQMQQLSTLSDTEAANQLYGLATGVDRISLFDVTRDLETQRNAILPPEENTSGRFEQLLDKKTQVQKELKALRRDEGHYAKLRNEYRDLQQKIKTHEATKKLLDGKGDWSETSEKVRKQWARCRKLNDRLTRIGPVADIPKHVEARVTATLKQVKEQRRKWEQVRDERRRYKVTASKLKGRDTLYRHAAEIEALDRQSPRMMELEADVQRWRKTVQDLEFELQAEMEQLGMETGVNSNRLPPISDQIIEGLRIPARETRELRASVEALKELAESCRKESVKLKGELESAALRFGGEGIGEALARSETLVQNLERRLTLDEHSEGIVRRLEEMEEDSKYWQGRGVLPWRGVLTLGAIFSAGAMLLVSGLIYDRLSFSEVSMLPMMLIGGCMSAISLIIKGSLESSARDRVELCQQQLSVLYEEQERTRAEVSEIDQGLPASGGHLDQRLLDAREEMVQLNQYLPLQRRFEELQREAEATDHQVTLAIRQLKESRRVWKASLRTVGLPETMTPTNIGEIKGRVGEITRLRNQVETARSQLNERQQEFDVIGTRIQQLLALGEIHDVPKGLSPQLARLLAELEKHAKSGKQVDELRQQWDDLGKQQNRLAESAKKLIANRRQLLAAHGITSDRDLRDTQARGEKAAAMRRERNRLLSQISDLLGEEYSVIKLQKLLDRRSNSILEYVKKIDEDRQSVGEDLNTLYERSGQLKQRLDGQMNDRRADHKELALRSLDEHIQAVADDWQRSALLTAMLDNIKQNYETKRQPVALAEASRHLERLTEGRYVRIWTPMGKNALCVDDANGAALPVEKLSRGTRELVFLSLRLALVSSYQRRGASMPVVLDDVFVNFDDKRAFAAAGVLADLANAGQQMLIFTCHERIRNVFNELGADVRDLPTRTGIAKRVTRVEDVIQDSEPVVEPAIPEPPIEEETVPVDVAEIESPVDHIVAEEIELPVYDADSWDEAVEKLAIQLPTKPVAAEREVVEEPWDDELAPIEEMADQFQPAWRDEWLTPLPDLE